MFKLEIFVAKKHLADVFERLTGIADVQSVAMVPNVEAKPNGRLHVIANDSHELIVKELHKRNITEIMGPDFKKLLTAVKLNPASYSHYLQQLVGLGMLRKGEKVGTTLTYHVTGK